MTFKMVLRKERKSMKNTAITLTKKERSLNNKMMKSGKTMERLRKK